MLKPGVNYLIEHNERRSEIYVGTATAGIKLSSHAAILFIQKSNGQSELNEIMGEIGISNTQALEILQPLITHNLIALLNRPTPIMESEDFATQISAARIKPELNTIAWRSNEGAISELIRRANFTIHIQGSNRLAFALLELFLSIGYLNCKIIGINKGEVAPQLIGATPFRIGDIGLPLNNIQEKINRDFALNFSALKADKNLEIKGKKGVDLLIKTSDFLPDQITNLMLDGVAHLQIGNLSAGKIEIGPLVIPGKSPCFNCIWLWRSERFYKLEIAQKMSSPLEISAAGVTYLSGLIVTLVDSYLAQERSFLIGSSLLINLLKPLDYSERFWQPNPKCGCLELL